MNHSPRRTSAALVAAFAAALIFAGLASASAAAAESFLSGYVTNEESSSLTKFNATTNQGEEQVQSQLEEPGKIAINADATKAYVGETCHEIEPNHGTVVETEIPSSGITRSVQLSTEGCASAIAISPKPDVGDSGETVWVVVGDEVFPIDSADDSVGEGILPPPPCPPSGCEGAEVLQDVDDVALSPDGNTLYMLYTEEVLEGEHCMECGNDTSVDDQLVAVEVGGATAIPGEPAAGAIGQGRSLAVSADGRKAFTTTAVCHIDQICINALDSYALGPEPVRTNSQTFSLTEAGQILLDPNGRWAWVAQTPGTFFLGESIETFDLETGPPYEDEDHEFDEDDPIALAVNPDAKTLYVGFHDRETIAALETEGQGEVEIPVGEGPVGGIAITPAQAPEAKLEVHAGGEAEPTYFDASGSQITCNSAECGEIATYDWNFGDGKEETTTTPTIQHSYLGSGPFTATVTETSSEGVSTEPLYDGHEMLENGGPQARATVTVTLPTLATQASAPTRRGGTINDTATLAEGEGLGGAIEFQVWGPTTPNCEGSPLETWNVPVSGDGEYSSGQYTATEVGTYNWAASYTNADADPPLSGTCGDANESVIVGKVEPTISSSATPGVVLGGQVGDVATLGGGDSATGTVTFELFEPGDAFCTGTPVFTHVGQLGEEFAEPEVVRSAAFTPARAGKYRWVASYSGDAQNEAVSGACGEPSELTTVGKVSPTIATQASPAVGLGDGLISDTATVSGGHEASGRVVFALYGPADPACVHTALFSTSVPLSADGTATSSGFVPASAGEYHWVATYTGDANNESVKGNCGDPGESVTVGKATPGFEAKAVERVTIGADISDTATLSGAINPSGTITFSLFGPQDTNCAMPLHTTTVAVHGNGSFSAEPFTPTAPGEYHWVAEYSGDARNEGDVAHCGDPGETSTVEKATPTLSVSTTGSVELGGAVAATATLSGGDRPTGMVTFQLFAPGDTACTGAPVFTATVPLSTEGAAASGPFTPLAAGTYAWRVAYSGDEHDSAVVGPCGSSSTVEGPSEPSSGPQSSGSPSASTQSSSPAPEPEADLRVKLSAPRRGSIGKSLVYRVKVANDGDATARSVGLTDRLGGAQAKITAKRGGSCKGDDRAVTCKLGSFPPGKEVRIEITVRAKAVGRLTLTSTVVAASGDAKAGDNRAAATIAITAGHRDRP